MLNIATLIINHDCLIYSQYSWYCNCKLYRLCLTKLDGLYVGQLPITIYESGIRYQVSACITNQQSAAESLQLSSSSCTNVQKFENRKYKNMKMQENDRFFLAPSSTFFCLPLSHPAFLDHVLFAWHEISISISISIFISISI